MINGREITTKDELLEEMDRAWNSLQATIANAHPRDLVERTDAAGWSAKDHVAHLAAWENSVLGMIRDGRPQWEGLGIDKALFEAEGYDEENEIIRQQTVDWPLDRVISHLTAVHTEMVRMVEGFSDRDLHRPCSDFVTGGQDFAIFHKISGNGPGHYNEHREYIERILEGHG